MKPELELCHVKLTHIVPSKTNQMFRIGSDFKEDLDFRDLARVSSADTFINQIKHSTLLNHPMKSKTPKKEKPDPGTEPVTGVKGFNRNLTCNGFQFEIGKEYFEDVKPKACSRGFHFCENPIDIFTYYPPGESRYATVESRGTIDREGNDSKIATNRLFIKAEINLKALIDIGVKFILDRVKWKDAPATNTGYSSAATNTGDRSAATNTGYRSAATNTGVSSAAIVEGEESVAMSVGIQGKAKGKKGCWLVLAEWEERRGNWHRKDVQSRLVDGEQIKEGVFYSLINGVFQEVK